MFSNSTEGEMFTEQWCQCCRYAYEGNQLCDEASPILFGEDPPDFLVEVQSTRTNPTGVRCTRFDPRENVSA